MRVGIATDHRGVEIKQELTKFLKEIGYNVVDYGTNNTDAVDYPDYAFKVGEAVAKKDIDFGVLICNTGIGMSIAANKVKGVRCARVLDEYDARMTRIDNDSNVIALSCRVGLDDLKSILQVFLTTIHIPCERHDRRIGKINNYEC